MLWWAWNNERTENSTSLLVVGRSVGRCKKKSLGAHNRRNSEKDEVEEGTVVNLVDLLH
jgi:hypothetical protein